MTAVALRPEPLTSEGSAPFGTAIAFDGTAARSVNEGTAKRADTAALFTAGAGARPRPALYRATPQAFPLALSLFERHPEAAQSFLSISVPRFLLVVALPDQDGFPNATKARAFLGYAGTGLSYRSNQWHTPILAIGQAGDLAMLMAEHGDERDRVEHRLAQPITILEP